MFTGNADVYGEFNKLYEVYEAYVLSAARRSLRDGYKGWDDDVAQEVWIKVFVNLGLPLAGDPRPLLATMVRHEAFNVIRTETRRRGREAKGATGEAVTNRDAEAIDVAELVQKATAGLTPDAQTALALRGEGHSLPEVACRMGKQEWQVKAVLRGAKSKSRLEEKLADRGRRNGPCGARVTAGAVGAFTARCERLKRGWPNLAARPTTG